MVNRIQAAGLQISDTLYEMVTNEVLPGTGIEADNFWDALSRCLEEFGPRNRELLKRRDELQQLIDDWHLERAGEPHNDAAYRLFLQTIGYLQATGGDFTITTSGTDPEIHTIAGPQLVVPVMNARFALNATNARWGSLYDSIYGTDMIADEGETVRGTELNPARAQPTVSYVMNFLDSVMPLQNGSHADVTSYTVTEKELVVTLADHSSSGLAQVDQFAGYRGEAGAPSAILLRNHGLHIELSIDRTHYLAAYHPAGLCDVVMEAAISTIQDCEDSVAAVDAADKTLVYRNWLGLMKGDLSETFSKGDKQITRSLNPDREYISPAGETFTLPGRSLLLIRNNGHLMTSDAILDQDGNEIPEGILDGMLTSLIALHDLRGHGSIKNSRAGSIYIVKPKMHGADEVAFTNDLFDFIEDALGLSRNTIKLGIMDEERRTSLNLKSCIRAAKERVVFINTGFLDRTGDEIHTSMMAGAMVTKTAMKDTAWITAYEDSNVDIGIDCGLPGKAQIGKGMWAMPDEMSAMVESKISHPQAGANTAWVPSPTAAVLHAMHYHQVNVAALQEELASRVPAVREDMLAIPLLGDTPLTAREIEQEIENNVQGILGYVVRWVDQGIGCSKVPDIRDVGLMEDRATLRISSQHLANWLQHGICTAQQVQSALERMAIAVDRQNAGDPGYRNMAPDFADSLAFQAACDLIFKGREQPNGYTEPLLYQYRRRAKAEYSG
jgi:malate synthase